MDNPDITKQEYRALLSALEDLAEKYANVCQIDFIHANMQFIAHFAFSCAPSADVAKKTLKASLKHCIDEVEKDGF